MPFAAWLNHWSARDLHWEGAVLLEDTKISRLTEECRHINSLKLCEVPLIDADLICKVPPMTRQVFQLLPGSLRGGHSVWMLQKALSAKSK